MRESDDLLILPIVTAEAGGFLVKQVNARGDRAIHAADFFRLNSIDETQDIHVEAWPRALIAGFVVQNLFRKDRKLSLQYENKLDSILDDA